MELRHSTNIIQFENLLVLLPVGVGLFHGILRKAFHGPTHERLWSGKIIQVDIDGHPCVSSLPVPPWKNSNCVFSKDKTKTSAQSFCLTLKLSPFQTFSPSG